jgi:hypothetical protein
MSSAQEASFFEQREHTISHALKAEMLADPRPCLLTHDRAPTRIGQKLSQRVGVLLYFDLLLAGGE